MIITLINIQESSYCRFLNPNAYFPCLIIAGTSPVQHKKIKGHEPDDEAQ